MDPIISCKNKSELLFKFEVKLRHYDSQTQLRKLLWHEDDLVTTVSIFLWKDVLRCSIVKVVTLSCAD